MAVGRKPKPTALKIIEGNPGKRKLPDLEPRFDPSQPSPPPFLNDDAKVEWGRVSSLLYDAGVLTDIDRAALAAYCQAYGVWAQAERQIAKLQQSGDLAGLMMKTKDGNYIQQPLLGIANKARADMIKFASEFGMTPSSRVRVETSGANKRENPFAKNGKRQA
jgi:P27 family predicted phage terminase small subunit